MKWVVLKQSHFCLVVVAKNMANTPKSTIISGRITYAHINAKNDLLPPDIHPSLHVFGSNGAVSPSQYC